jgi:hypothetical protein
MSGHGADLLGHRTEGEYWEERFCELACEYRRVWYTRNQKGRRDAAHAETIDPAKIRRTCLLPDVVIWSIPGEHHEIKHKKPHKQPGFAPSFGLEVYRFEALVEFADECRQPVLYTIHDWQAAGAPDSYHHTPNRLDDWFTIPILDLNAKRHRRDGKFGSYRNGQFVEAVPGYYWPASIWTPLAQYWDKHQPELWP